MLLYDRNIIGPSSEIFGCRRKSSVIFGKRTKNVQRSSSFLWKNFGKSSDIFAKWSEIFRKSSKRSSLVCLYNKQNITCPLVDMNFIFSCSTGHLTRSLCSLVRYRVEHSRIKFISTRRHVISSIYLWRNLIVENYSVSPTLHTDPDSNGTSQTYSIWQPHLPFKPGNKRFC